MAFMTGNSNNVNDDKDKINFIFDSGATDHLINQEDISINFKILDTPIKITAVKQGDLHVVTNMGISTVLQNVYYCPELPHNLLTVTKLLNNGLYINFNKNKGLKIFKDGRWS